MLKSLTRRGVVAGFAACGAARRSWSAPAALPSSAALLVAGPVGGQADQWADLLCPALGKSLLKGPALARQNVGGADGVTGANQFDALATPDGSKALLVPGSAALSWLTGDSRVKFDAGRWVPIWAGNGSAALASRVPLAPGQTLRVAVSNVVGPVLAALLALDLMGIDVVPVPLTPNGALPVNDPNVDAVFLHGATARNATALLNASGMSLALGFGALSPTGEITRDRSFPELPTAFEMIARTRPKSQPELVSALHAVTAAVQLELALILPLMSPASVVAWWRQACGALAQSPDLQAEAARMGTRPASSGGAEVSTAAIVADVPVLLELRQWLSARYQWRPA